MTTFVEMITIPLDEYNDMRETLDLLTSYEMPEEPRL